MDPAVTSCPTRAATCTYEGGEALLTVGEKVGTDAAASPESPPNPKVVVPEATTSSVSERTAPATFKGALGETLALSGPGLNDVKTSVRVTVKAVRGPLKGYALPKGRKLVGVAVRFSNDGEGVYDDPQPRGELKLTGGKTGRQTNLIQLDGSKNPCENPSVKLKTGKSRNVCLAFEVPKSAKPETFEFVTDSGYGDTGVWTLR